MMSLKDVKSVKDLHWTRSWTIGTWYVDFSPIGGWPVYGFKSHAQAVAFEVHWLNNNWLGRS